MGKKKMTKEERKRFEAEKAEALRIEMEKERQRQLEEERQQKLKQLTEARERQKREKGENKMRRIQLADSCNFFKHIRENIEKIYMERRKLQEWRRYMRCNGLPNAYDPGDLRKYIHMWDLENEKFDAREQNWLLRTDERTVLTQNRMIPNVTRAHLQQQQPNLGDIYAKRAREVLGILDEIDEATTEPSSISESIVQELGRLKSEFREKMMECIDDFSFKILSNIERDMVLEGLLIATHFYECDVFKAHLWTKRDQPQPLLNEKERQKEAKSYISIDFSSLRLNLSLPPAVKCKNGAIRAMWLNFDHFSDYCPSYEMPGDIPITIDLSQAARKEWKKRIELEKCARTEMEPVKKQPSAEGAVPFDNFELINTPIVDVDKLYMDYIANLMKIDRKRKGPNALALKEFEINLRRYRIIGGVYCLEYCEQPEQNVKLSANAFLRTIYGSNTLKRRKFFQYYRAPAPTPPNVRRLPEEVEAEMKMVERGLSKLSYITIALPEDFIWFEPPTVCRWETVEETLASEKIENKTSDPQMAAQQSMKKAAKQSGRKEVTIEDFNLLDIPTTVDINFVVSEIIVPRIPDGYTIRVSDVKARRRSIMFTPLDTNTDNQEIITSIDDMFEASDSPRPLHPKLYVKTNVKIKERQMNGRKTSQPEYLFSKLLEDLECLFEMQLPVVRKQMDEISEMLSVSIDDEQEEAADVNEIESAVDDPTKAAFGDDFAWSFLRKPDESAADAAQIEKESEDEDSIEIDDDHFDENENQATIPKNKVIGRWSVRDVHDSKFNEEKLAIQFRAGRLGFFGLAVNWYANLPFQTWDLKPDTKNRGTVLFNLTAAVVSIELTITEAGIVLSQFQGGTATQIQDTIGIVQAFDDLKKLFLKSGINLFPDKDAFCYCETICEKDFVMESHVYDCMAHMGLTHNFMWSRWNSQLNSRSMVLLMREIIEKRKLPIFSTLYITPLTALLVDCTEVGTSFSCNPLAEMKEKFFADLYHLNKEISQSISTEKQDSMSLLLRDNLAQVLKYTRPLSCC